jgi:hypothetical protein
MRRDVDDPLDPDNSVVRPEDRDPDVLIKKVVPDVDGRGRWQREQLEKLWTPERQRAEHEQPEDVQL